MSEEFNEEKAKELEEKTGVNFFVNLPAETAATVKAEDPKNNAFWNLK